MRTETSRNGQAMIEMAIGMLVFALILSGLLMFGDIIPEAMRLQSTVRRETGYDAQIEMSGASDGAPIMQIENVLGEPEVVPVTPNETFNIALRRPMEYRMKTQTFSVDLDPVSSEWYFDGEKRFRGIEECYMPLMTIPEFSSTEVLQ